MEYKEQIAENIIAEVELNDFQSIFGEKEWQILKNNLIFAANHGELYTDFWDKVKFIAEEIADFTRR